ncbi:MAG: CerR family C-terminal domain-containing protein [Desulfatibacillaceae bacterium]|nr:CerR family C-terminal domain-containing protein [Desulfatibacillaceae bacterium]
MKNKSREEDAQDRILDAAEILFAQKGFAGVAVREITSAARVNVAAVNYHFGSKKALYLEVFRQRWVARVKRVQQFFLARLEAAEKDDHPEKVFARALAEAILAGPLKEEERLRHAQLIGREMIQPTEAFALVMEHAFKPMIDLCVDYFAKTRPQDSGKLTLTLDSFSLFGMIIYFNLARPVISHVTGRAYDKEFTEQIVEHIATFAANGLAGRRAGEKT